MRRIKINKTLINKTLRTAVFGVCLLSASGCSGIRIVEKIPEADLQKLALAEKEQKKPVSVPKQTDKTDTSSSSDSNRQDAPAVDDQKTPSDSTQAETKKPADDSDPAENTKPEKTDKTDKANDSQSKADDVKDEKSAVSGKLSAKAGDEEEVFKEQNDKSSSQGEFVSDSSSFAAGEREGWTTQALNLYRSSSLKGVPGTGLPKGAHVTLSAASQDGKVAEICTSPGVYWYARMEAFTFEDPAETERIKREQEQRAREEQERKDKEEEERKAEEARRQKEEADRKAEEARQQAAEEEARRQQEEADRKAEEARQQAAAEEARRQQEEADRKAEEARRQAAEEEARRQQQAAQTQPSQPSQSEQNHPAIPANKQIKYPGRTDFVISGQHFANQTISAVCVYNTPISNAPREAGPYQEQAGTLGQLKAGQAVTVIAVSDGGWCRIEWSGRGGAYVPIDSVQKK